MFKIHDNFDLARLLGSRAFDALAIALKAYEQLNELGLDVPDDHPWHTCLSHGTRLQSLRQHELMFCFDAIILFQASMEKIPSWIQELSDRLTGLDEEFSLRPFEERWRTLIKQLPKQERPAAHRDFSNFKNYFYDAMRNPLVHGCDEKNLKKINKIRAIDVHAGMKSGWAVYDCLLTHAFRNAGEPHSPSWADICSGSGIPANLNSDAYPDLNELSRSYFKRHEAGCRQAAAQQRKNQ